MKRLLLACVFGLAGPGVDAAPVLTCEEIDVVGESLTELGIAMDDGNAEIGEGSPEDEALRQTIIGLADIAEAEDDIDLANASAGMADAWNAMDRDAFVDALADAVAKLAVVSASQCE